VKLITILMPELYLKLLEDLISQKYYPNRAEAIRTAVRDLLVNENPSFFCIKYPSQSSEKIEVFME